jgi:hypothetical protein
MDYLAFAFAVVAALVFLDGCRAAPVIRRTIHTNLGLALRTVAWICQCTTLTDHLINW